MMHFSKFILLLSSIFIFCQTEMTHTVYAQELKPSTEMFKKQQVIRSINILRAKQRQAPLTLADVDGLLQKEVRLNATVESGSIAGILSGIHEDYIFYAVVVAWSVDSTSSSGTADFGKVQFDGRYRIENLTAGKYYVLALVDGYLPNFYENVTDLSQATPVAVQKDTVTAGIDFKMERIKPGNGGIAGVVLSESDNHPVTNADVTAFSLDNPFLYGRAKSLDDGSYQIQGLNNGKYYVSAIAEEYLIEFYFNTSSIDEATAVEVIEPGVADSINFSLVRGGIISGVVVNDENLPIAGAYVEAMTREKSIDPSTPDSVKYGGWGFALTNDKGEYRITGLLKGDYYVLAQAWNKWNRAMEWYDNAATLAEATPVPVEPGAESKNINFQLSLPLAIGEIVGTVTDLNGQPIEGAYIQAQSPFLPPDGRVDIWSYAYTDKYGKYRIKDLPNGQYLVSASARSGWQFVQRWWPDAESPDKAQPVDVNGFTDLTPIDFKLPITFGSAIISGRVQSSSGAPLTNAFIQVQPANVDSSSLSDAVWAYARTDCTGYYQVERLPAGDYIAHAQYWELQSFGQQWYDHADKRADATPIKLTDGDRRNDINFDLTLRPYYGAIAGTVIDEVSGAPVHRAYVEITPLESHYFESAPIRMWPFYAITNEQGNFKFEWLPEGDYIISVHANSAFEYFENVFVPEEATAVHVTGGSTTAINFALLPRNEGPGVISGKVTSDWPGGQMEIAVVVARPVVTPLVYPDSERFYNAVTNPDSTYKITGLPAGEYYVFSFAPGYIGEFYDNAYDPTDATVVKVDSSHPAENIDFSLSPMLIMRPDFSPGPQNGATIFGKVTDEQGAPITGATIYLLNDTEQPVSFTQSKSHGMYEIRNVPPGKYRLKASQIGYQSKYNNSAENFQDAVSLNVNSGRLEVNFSLRTKTVTGVDYPTNTNVPESIVLYGNFPNPFNPETRISFGLPNEMRIQLRIFNLLGQEVRQLFEGVLGAGEHSIIWDGRNKIGETMPSGIYFYALNANDQKVVVKKMTLLK